MRRSEKSYLCGATALLALTVLSSSCMNSGITHLSGPDGTYGRILSREQAGETFLKARSKNADVQVTHQFFLDKSFLLKSVEALKQGQQIACIAFYSKTGQDEKLGILAIKLRGDSVVQTTAGILWITGSNPSFSNEIEGPKVASSSATTLSAWWSCLFGNVGMTSWFSCSGYDPYNPNPARWVACKEANSGFPLVYHWFRYCY